MKSWRQLAVHGSVASALAFMVAVGCGDDNGTSGPGQGGEGGGESPGAAGSASLGGSESRGGNESLGGSEAAGGSESLGGSEAAGGSGNVDPTEGGAAGQGAGGESGEPVDPNASVARFCNAIGGLDDENIPFVLEIGEGEEKVTFTADSFTCAPPDGNACRPIPIGLEVPVALYEQGDPEPWYEGTIFSEEQDQWLFYTILLQDGEIVVPSLDGGTTNGVLACDDTTYETAYPPQ